MKRLTMLTVAAALVGGVLVLSQHGKASAFATPNRQCPPVLTLGANLGRGPAIRILTHNMSCSRALGIVRAMVSGVGVTFIGNPQGRASQFRWRLYGLPGWTCYGDGSGFPEGGAGGDCAMGSSTVEWYHASTR
jgi:hypothetical protein